MRAVLEETFSQFLKPLQYACGVFLQIFLNQLINPCMCLQAVRGKFMSIKKTMTMGDLLRQMVTDAKLEAEQALRQLVANLNGAAALHIIRQVSGTLLALKSC